ncbi:MAG: transporter substrate-binding domain-containing protein [Pseudomonadota bacterium]
MTLLSLGASTNALACGPYNVAFYETGSLYFKNDNGEYTGIDKDVMAELAKRTACKLNIFLDSRVRTWTALADGTLDMTVSALATPEREVFAQFVPYIQNNRNYLIVKNELPTHARSLAGFADSKSLKLGVVRGFKHGASLDPWIDGLRAAGRVFEEADLEALARLLALGRIDGFFTQPVVWEPLLRRNHLENKVSKLDVAPMDSANLGLAFSRKRVAAEDIKLIQRAIEAMRADGTLAAIYARYLDPATARAAAAAPAAH